jgi:hypothetical protein
MGGEPGLTLVRWSPRHRLPDDYEVVFDGHLYWWQRRSNKTDYGGGDVDRWIVRRLAIKHANQKPQ